MQQIQLANGIFRVSDDNLDELLAHLIARMSELDGASTDKPRMYASGEWSSGQTTFEKLSNQCKIASVANSPIVGLAVLRLMRYDIDNHQFNLFQTDINSALEEAPILDIDELISYLASTENQYSIDAAIDEPLKCELSRYVNGSYRVDIISRSITEIDLWTVGRLQRVMPDCLC